MKRSMDQKASTSTAATQQTEPEVVAAISSADGQVAGEQAIRERAYAIWEEEGRPEGRHLDHWLRAEAEINLSSSR
jgi:Protein of unknown function (DUF2934)